MVVSVETLRRHGDAPVLVLEDGGWLSYGELAARVQAQLEAFGARRRLILLEAAPRVEAVVAYLAALAGHHVVVLVAPGADAHARELAAVYQPEILFAERAGAWHGRAVEGIDPPELHPDLALLLSTSGSTGSSKLVRLSRVNLRSNAQAIATFLELKAEDRGALTLPFHYSYGLSVLNAHLARGASLLLPRRSVIEPGFLDLVAGAGCTNLAGVPYSFELFEQIGLRSWQLPALRFMTVAGGRLSPDLVRRYAAHFAARGGRFFVMYGQTEATARIAYLPPEEARQRPDAIGRAIPGGSLSLVDGAGQVIEAADTVGELVYRGPNVMMGYAEGPADLARGHEVTALRTGDLAERGADGCYRLVGRRSRFSKIAGLRVSHDEVERRLAACGVAAAVSGNDRRLVAAVTSGQPPEAVAGIVREVTGLKAHQVHAFALAELPRLPSGKIDHVALQAAGAQAAERDQGADQPQTVLEAFAWAFHPREVRPSDSFVSLGGDSLTYLQLSLALQDILKALPEGWERQPVSRLAVPVPEAPRRRWLDVDLLLRPAAVLLVVVHHATQWPIPGGASVLLMLVGYNLARFQADALVAGELGVVLRGVLRNIGLYYLILVAFFLHLGEVWWPSLLLVGVTGVGGYPVGDSFLIVYWFVEAYAQVMLAAVALFAVPAVRAAVAARPFACGLVFLAACVAARPLTPLVWDAGSLNIFLAPTVVYLVAFGWCACFAATVPRKIALTAVALVLFPLFALTQGMRSMAAWDKAGLLVLAAVLLLWVPKLPAPRWVTACLLTLAAASYHIYLAHNIPPHFFLQDLPVARPVQILVHVASGVGLGLLAYACHRAVSRRWSGWRDGGKLRPWAWRKAASFQ